MFKKFVTDQQKQVISEIPADLLKRFKIQENNIHQFKSSSYGGDNMIFHFSGHSKYNSLMISFSIEEKEVDTVNLIFFNTNDKWLYSQIEEMLDGKVFPRTKVCKDVDLLDMGEKLEEVVLGITNRTLHNWLMGN